MKLEQEDMKKHDKRITIVKDSKTWELLCRTEFTRWGLEAESRDDWMDYEPMPEASRQWTVEYSVRNKERQTDSGLLSAEVS